MTIKPEVELSIKEEDCDNEDSNEYIDVQVDIEYQTTEPKSMKHIVKSNVKRKKKTSKELKCEICFQESSTKDLLKTHYNKIHKRGNFKICSYCDDYKTEKKGWYRLKEHIDKKHPDSGEKKHFCDQCNQGFIFFHSLNRHKATHNKHVCYICGAEYIASQNLKEHMLVKHNSKDATSIVCEICGFSTISRQKLSLHISRTHKPEGTTGKSVI